MIRFRPGQANANEDGLSRRNRDKLDGDGDCSEVIQDCQTCTGIILGGGDVSLPSKKSEVEENEMENKRKKREAKKKKKKKQED